MNEDENKNIPYLAFESVFIRFERINKRLWILCIILVILLVGSNIAWLAYESQFQTVESTTVTQDVEATADENSDLDLNTIGGDYYGGESESSTDSN